MLSIIIINYYSADLIMDCLASIQAETSVVNYELIIVDNSSDEIGRRQVLTGYPDVNWISMGYNAGFARANNKGIEAAKGEYVLLLNPDTIITEGALDGVCPLFTASGYVACGVQLLNEDRSFQISGNYAMRGGLNYLLPLPYVGACLKWLGELLGIKKANLGTATALSEVDWINGAFLMVKTSAIKKAGLLDPDFFLYAEEAEWCSRLKKVGPLAIYGSYHVLHLQGETANEAFQSEGKGYYNLYDKKGFQFIISNFLRIRKQFGAGWLLFDTIIYSITIPIFVCAKLLDNLFHLRSPFEDFKRVGGFTKNVIGLWGYLPRIIRNKPHFYKVL